MPVMPEGVEYLLVEVVRGCANLCRFCWAGYNYLPVRPFPAAANLRHSRVIALPGVPDKMIRDRIVESVKLADIVKPKVADAWSATGKLPVDNAAAGLPVADKIVNEYISAVAIESGAIQITFGNRANVAIQGKVLSLRPGVIEDARIVPVSWVCGNAEPPNKMVAKGLNKTDVPVRFLPLNCRAAAAASAPP